MQTIIVTALLPASVSPPEGQAVVLYFDKEQSSYQPEGELPKYYEVPPLVGFHDGVIYRPWFPGQRMPEARARLWRFATPEDLGKQAAENARQEELRDALSYRYSPRSFRVPSSFFKAV